MQGKHHHAFSDEAELEPAAMIVDQYNIPGRQFIGLAFRELALAAYAWAGRDPGAFKCSQQLMSDFKCRHGFSSR
jgi:hypothetical protein